MQINAAQFDYATHNLYVYNVCTHFREIIKWNLSKITYLSRITTSWSGHYISDCLRIFRSFFFVSDFLCFTAVRFGTRKSVFECKMEVRNVNWFLPYRKDSGSSAVCLYNWRFTEKGSLETYWPKFLKKCWLS